MFEKFAAPAYPFFAFHDDARELARKFCGQVLENSQLVKNIRFDRLLIFCSRQRFLQDIGEQLAKRRVFGRTSALLVLPVDEADVDGLTNEIEQIFSRKIDEAGAQKNVIMDVVNAQGQIRQPNFGGIRLKFHPGGMRG